MQFSIALRGTDPSAQGDRPLELSELSVTPNAQWFCALAVTVTLVFKQKSLGCVFDSSTKSLEDSRKVITFAGRTVKRNYVKLRHNKESRTYNSLVTMKLKNVLCYLLFASMLVVIGCSSSDSEEQEVLPVLVGSWEMEYSDSNVISPNESVFEFRQNGTLTVYSKSKSIYDTYFLPSGAYTYSITKDRVTFSGVEKVFNYRIVENKLELFFLEDNAYPASLLYVFHRK